MGRKDWLALVACHSDAWLFSVAFFFAVKLDAPGRAALFRALNLQPTLFEVATGRAEPSAAPEAGRLLRAALDAPGERGAGGGGGGDDDGGAPERRRRRRQQQQGEAGGGGTKRRAAPPAAPAAAVAALQLPPLPLKEVPASAGGSKQPDPRGRLVGDADVTEKLQGSYAEVRLLGGAGAGPAVAAACLRPPADLPAPSPAHPSASPPAPSKAFLARRVPVASDLRVPGGRRRQDRLVSRRGPLRHIRGAAPHAGTTHIAPPHKAPEPRAGP
jgi:hypothetical protein